MSAILIRNRWYIAVLRNGSWYSAYDNVYLCSQHSVSRQVILTM